MILEVITAGPVDTNAYLVGSEKLGLAFLIDAPMGSADQVILAAKRHDVKIVAILLTHSHWDHIADLHLLKQATGAPIHVHAEDAPNVLSPGADRLPLPISITPETPDHLFQEGERIFLAPLATELCFTVLSTPGHSSGSVCFYFEKEHILFSGDTLFRNGIGNTSFPTSNPRLMRSSLKRLGELPPQTKVYPGHGEPTTIGAEHL